MNERSLAFFKKPFCFIKEGGTIPVVAMLGSQFPNAHEPNAFLHAPHTKKLKAYASYVLGKFSS